MFMTNKLKTGRRRVVLVSMLLVLAVIGAPRAATGAEGDATLLPPAPLHERVLSLPGDPTRPVMLQVTLFMPDGPGPFPLAVMNHGAAGSTHPQTEPRYRTTFSAYYFLSRGYAVALPMMPGFAGSGGRVEHHGCDVVATGTANARDIAAVIDGLSAQPDVDASRIVVAGQSFGGWNTLAFGTLDHAGVKGLANFAGGMRESDCATQDASLVASSAYLGAHTRLPSIWFYGDNDKMFPAETWGAMHARYTSAGGRAELVAYGSFMDDAHQLLSHAESLADLDAQDGCLPGADWSARSACLPVLPADTVPPCDAFCRHRRCHCGAIPVRRGTSHLSGLLAPAFHARVCRSAERHRRGRQRRLRRHRQGPRPVSAACHRLPTLCG
jgi:dienelactone hydrolase